MMRSELDRKLYLVSFEFISGEYGQVFNKTFYVGNESELENKIHSYLVDYYGAENTSEIDSNVYYYCNGEVAVKIIGWEEIVNLEQIACKLAY